MPIDVNQLSQYLRGQGQDPMDMFMALGSPQTDLTSRPMPDLATQGAPPVQQNWRQHTNGFLANYLQNIGRGFQQFGLSGAISSLVNPGYLNLALRSQHIADEKQQVENEFKRSQTLKNYADAHSTMTPGMEDAYDAGELTGLPQLQGKMMTAAELNKLAPILKEIYAATNPKKKTEQKNVNLGPLGGNPPGEYATEYNPQAEPGEQYALPGTAATGGRRFVDALLGPKPDATKNNGVHFETIGGKVHQITTAPDGSTISDQVLGEAGNANANLNRSDRSYQFHSGQLDKLAQPVRDRTARLGNLVDSINQNSPQADALIAPELLTTMAGGQGSGLRMNEAEIARIVGGRNIWQDIKAKLDRWQADPSKPFSITPSQRQQVKGLIATVKSRLDAKQQVLDDARQQLINADDPKQHRAILADVNKKLSGIDSGDTSQAAATPQGANQTMEQFSPSRNQWRHSNDGGKTWQPGRAQ